MSVVFIGVLVTGFFFNATATTEIYTLSLHDALPISAPDGDARNQANQQCAALTSHLRSEEHTSELQSHSDLVCRLLLEKKKLEDRTAGHAGLGQTIDPLGPRPLPRHRRHDFHDSVAF